MHALVVWSWVVFVNLMATGSTAGVQHTEAAEIDRVSYLPGWGSVRGFGLFSGYITVNEEAGRNTFFAFVEATHSPNNAPVILWLNGGPGCSSIGGGFMSEVGPWFPTPNGELQWNPHSWNRFANMLFIESPHGVGFSYSEHDEDLITGDARTAADSYAFLVKFFERYPQFAGNDFFIAGESYAGHYIPQLAWEIIQGNRQTDGGEGGGGQRGQDCPTIYLAGFLLGNPLTVPAIDSAGAVDFWWSHALISDESAAGMKAHCNFSSIGPLLEAGEDEARLCDKFVERSQDELGNINIYEIYADVCLEIKRGGAQRRMAELLQGHPAGMAARAAVAVLDRSLAARLNARKLSTRSAAQETGQGPSRTTMASQDGSRHEMRAAVVRDDRVGDDYHGPDPEYDPCVDDEVEWYLNKPEVQRALHANQTRTARRFLPGRWKDCSSRVVYSMDDLLQSVLPLYRDLIQANLSMLIYSGDVDGIVPVIGSRRWVTSLGLPIKSAWRPWTDGRQQVGGYIVKYEGITFSTVRNAGHMVPYTQPERMYNLAKMFLADTLHPKQ